VVFGLAAAAASADEPAAPADDTAASADDTAASADDAAASAVDHLHAAGVNHERQLIAESATTAMCFKVNNHPVVS
jgi:hypothetical protein